jgi:mitogen-activated protein kinase 1/3
MPKKILDIGDFFTVLDFIGSGAYGHVYACKNNITLEYVAIKNCKNILSSRTLAKRTLRELRILRYCSHPNIITLKSIIMPQDLQNFTELNLIFELMDTDLAQVIRSSQKLLLEHIQYFGFQLLSALDYLHRGGVIHRDVK